VRSPVIEPQRLAVLIGNLGFTKPPLKFRGMNLRIFLDLDEVRSYELRPASGYAFLGFGGG
jgi:hypothetical protein